ncbi:MAG: GntR family transcriptional regulator [Desulfobacterales bacterium]|nr:GntR family transcriptional regulator [Desulfobacterales bacterium]
MSEQDDKATLMKTVEGRIREEIITGGLKPGTHLKETQLARQLEVSRFPVREALALLAKDGLVETIPYKGTFVKQLTQKDIREVFTVRGSLEELALRSMIPRATPEMVDELKACVGRMEGAEAQGDWRTSAREDIDFHRLLCRYSANDRLLSVWEGLAPYSETFFCMGKTGYGIDTEYVRTHWDLVRAIELGDVERAVAHIRLHIMDGIDYLLAHSCYHFPVE